jgi:hypothetical protein
VDYLYHYTSIENLALILKSKNIRFKALDTVDDLNEGIAADVDEYGQFVFVSCWTDETEESIPIWNMYAKDMSGVRIALPKYPFNHYSFDDLTKMSDVPFSRSTIFNGLHFDSGWIPQQGEHYLVNMQYTDDEELLKPKIVESLSKNSRTIWAPRVGMYKNTCWRFQSEVRYRIIVYPGRHGFKPTSNDKFQNQYKMNSDYIDIPIRDNAFNEMKILLGPKQSEGLRLIAEMLIEKYNTNAKIETSNLKIRH